MADAIIFGAPNTLTGRLADILSDLLKVRERYQQSQEQNADPGVAIVTTHAGLSTDAPALIFADGLRKDRKLDDPDRRAWLARLAEGAARGAATFVITSADEARHLKTRLKAEGLPVGEPLRRLLVIKEVAEQALPDGTAETLRLPHFVVNEPVLPDESDSWPAEVAESDRWMVETAYSPAIRSLIDAADLVVAFDFGVTPPETQGRPPLRERLLVGALRRALAPVTPARRAEEFSEVAHQTPVLVLRNQAERDAVAEALLLGASLPAPHAR